MIKGIIVLLNGKRVLALIPARGGSKGIKDKNIRDLCGKPLIAYTIDAALQCAYIDDVVVTTDSEQIAHTACEYGARVPFIRPLALAEDRSRTIDAVLHAVRELERQGERYEVLILLQPTSPLRSSRDIEASVELFREKNEESVVSVSLVQDPPVLIRELDDSGILHPVLKTGSTVRRQDMKEYYRVNGGIYINRINEITEDTSFNDNKYGYRMSREHSVDIDEEADLMLAEYLLNNHPDGRLYEH